MRLGLPRDGRRLLALNAAVGTAANVAKVGLQLVLLPVMARLLGPAEFGVYALVLPLVAFFTVLADGGLGTSLARESEASTVVWSTAFWLLLATCTAIALVVTAGGTIIGVVADQPRLGGITALLSTSFPLMALSALPAARLVRRGNLVLQSVGDLVSNLIGAGVALTLALSDAGAWSLAAQYASGFLVRAVLFNLAAFERPRLTFRIGALWPHVTTGGSLIGSRLAEFAGRACENLAYGQAFGPAALGGYTLANQIARFLCEAAGNPLWGSLYAYAVRADPGEVRVLHARLTRVLASALFPAAALLTASAPEVFDFALGPAWSRATTLVQILLPSYALNVVASQGSAILLAGGRAGTVFWTLAILSLLRLLAVLAGPWIGVVGVACGVAAANVVFAILMVGVLGRVGSGPASVVLKGLAAPLAASIAAGLACRGLLMWRPEGPAWTVSSLCAGGSLYLIALIVLERKTFLSDAVALRRLVLRH